MAGESGHSHFTFDANRGWCAACTNEADAITNVQEHADCKIYSVTAEVGASKNYKTGICRLACGIARRTDSEGNSYSPDVVEHSDYMNFKNANVCPNLFYEDGKYNKAECLKCAEILKSFGNYEEGAYGCGFTPETEEICTGTNCSGYRGSQSETVSGKTCQSWGIDVPHNRGLNTANHMPDAGYGVHNHCRNAGGKKSGLWCFTTDP
jgi:hypothetical protein